MGYDLPAAIGAWVADNENSGNPADSYDIIKNNALSHINEVLSEERITVMMRERVEAIRKEAKEALKKNEEK